MDSYINTPSVAASVPSITVNSKCQQTILASYAFIIYCPEKWKFIFNFSIKHEFSFLSSMLPKGFTAK